MEKQIFHALVLNLHQPAGNLEELLETRNWEAREILYALDRIPRMMETHPDLARVHCALSGTLLETLANPEFQARVYGIVKCGDLLWRFRHPAIERLGTGYYHPVLPLIPAADREEQVARWLGIGRHLFDQASAGFWPPEMGCAMELIPLLRRHGYRYVLVDCENLEPVTPMRWEELRYRPHMARFGGEEIVVIPRDRDLSNAQESGMDCGWFLNEAHARTQGCDFPALVTTCTDGENGGWFRNTTQAANFWGAFYEPFLQAVRAGGAGGVRPTLIGEYLDRFGAQGEVKILPAAWNTGWHHGRGFVQWTGSLAQQQGWARLTEVSRMIHETRAAIAARSPRDPEAEQAIGEALWRLLRAETSCHFFWGADWVWRAHRDLDQALVWLGKAAE